MQHVGGQKKTGRNQPCPCGSGKKFKRCHGTRYVRSKDQQMTDVFRSMEAREKLRARAEGHGRPIIAERFNDMWVVAVGKRFFWGREWIVFPDFLLHYLKATLGWHWGQRESARLPRVHPLFDWLEGLGEDKQRHLAAGGGAIIESSGGSAWAVFRFAYALYLIEHHDRIPNRFRKRLRDHVTFLPAVYEAFVGAAYAVAGYSLVSEETAKTGRPQPEFTVTRPGGRSYSVEAKRKSGWTAKIDVNDPTFIEELQRFIRRELLSASRKRLPNPVYWLELSIPRELDADEMRAVERAVRETLRDAERALTVDGQQPASAYVYVTSHAFLADHRAGGFMMVLLDGFHRQVYVEGEVEVETALALHDQHRDATWIMDCFREVALIPTSFEGVPAEALDADGKPIITIRIGERTRIELPDGTVIQGVLEEATSGGEVAYVAIHDEADGNRRIVTVPLSPEEQRAVAAHGDLVFGKPNAQKKLGDDDIVGLYDFFLAGYRETPRELLLSFLDDHPQRNEFASLETEELRRRVCREWVKAVVAQQAASRAEATSSASAG